MSGIAGFYNPNNMHNYNEQYAKWQHILCEMFNEFPCNTNINNPHTEIDGPFILNSNIGLTAKITSPCIKDHIKQPLCKKINNKNLILVFYGELYNSEQLKYDLQNYDLIFDSSSDAEILFNGFIIYGIDYIKKLNGAFSFVLWDERNNSLYLVRDAIGLKPLFYTIADNTLIFSSKLSALFKYPNVKPELDSNSYGEVFGLGPAKTHGTGIFKDVHEVIPGQYLIYNSSGVSSKTFWQLTSKPHTENYFDTVEHTSYLLDKAIMNQCKSDIPICTLLSGGLDSSLVSAICSKLLEKDNRTLDTYSFDFINNKIHFKSSAFQPSEDRPYIDIMKDYLKSNHTFLECDNDDLINGLYKAVDARDLPNMADIESSLLYFCSLISQNHGVALTGECADEIFGGYPWFRDPESFTLNTFPWSKNMETRKILLSDDFISHIDIEQHVRNAYENSIKEVPKLDEENETDARRREISYLNLKWFMTTLIDRMDRTSISANLIARSPFSDIHLIEYLWNVPWEMKFSNNTVKGLLRDVAKNHLPNEILYRKKSPFPKTYNPNYEMKLGNLLLEELSQSDAPLKNILDLAKVKKFLESPSNYGKPWYGQLMAAPQLIAYLLQINYWLKKFKL